MTGTTTLTPYLSELRRQVCQTSSPHFIEISARVLVSDEPVRMKGIQEDSISKLRYLPLQNLDAATARMVKTTFWSLVQVHPVSDAMRIVFERYENLSPSEIVGLCPELLNRLWGLKAYKHIAVFGWNAPYPVGEKPRVSTNGVKMCALRWREDVCKMEVHGYRGPTSVEDIKFAVGECS